MGTLPLHGSNAALHPRHPLHALPVLVAVVREAQPVFLVVLRAEVELDGHALEDALVLAIRLVDDGGDAAICYQTDRALARRHGGRGQGGGHTVDGEVPRVLLLVLGNVDFVDSVVEAELLEGAGDFLAVGGSGCVAVRIRGWSVMGVQVVGGELYTQVDISLGRHCRIDVNLIEGRWVVED